MAKIHNSFSELEERTKYYSVKTKKYGKIAFFLFIIVFSATFLLIFNHFALFFLNLSGKIYVDLFSYGKFFSGGVVIIMLLMIPTIVFTIFALYHRNQYKVLQSGLDGENITTDELARFPDTYEVFCSVNIPMKDRFVEIDNIVVGPNGIFIIEVKNHNGTIIGTEDDHDWIQHKVGRKGGEYSNTFYNPMKQVKKQIHFLSEYFKQHGISIWIEGAIYFTNREVIVNVRSSKIPVLTSFDELSMFIVEASRKKKSEKK